MDFKNNKTKATIAIQTIFFIMMSALMIWIVVYGVQKLFLVDSQLTEQDRIFVQNQIEETFEYCEDPLNKGNMKILEFNNKLFNSICVIGDEINTGYDDLNQELNLINDTGDNIVLLKTNFVGNNLKEYNVIATFKSYSKLSVCSFDKNNTGKLKYELICN